jgi:hypothetical protein
MKTMVARRLLVVVGLAALAGLFTAQARPQKPARRSEAMQKKLDLAKGLLEGIATEDFEMISRNAGNLKALIDSPDWVTPAIRDAQGYPELSHDFRRALDDLANKARARNIDGAALAYIQATTSCVNCHSFVRDRRSNQK